MQEDTIIQKDLFAINHELKRPNNSSQIPEDLSTEELKKESQKRPRPRKNSPNLINKFKNNSNFEERMIALMKNLTVIKQLKNKN